MKSEYAVLLVLAVALVAAFVVDSGQERDEIAAKHIIIKPAYISYEEGEGITPAGVGEPGTAHHHQTFLVFLNGSQYSFAKEQ